MPQSHIQQGFQRILQYKCYSVTVILKIKKNLGEKYLKNEKSVTSVTF